MKDKWPKRRTITEDERFLWDAVTRNAKPLGSRKQADATDANADDGQPVAAPEPARTQPRRHDPAPLPPKLTKQKTAKPEPRKPPPMASFEPRRARKIADGRIAIEASIDLHGMRQHEAHGELRRFLFSAHGRGLRVVKVITGKGGSAGDRMDKPFDLFDEQRRGVLKRMVPIWLAETDLRAIIVSHTGAGRGHGGEGALYIHLRRKRQSS